MRMARTRLSRAERAAGRGAFTTDAHTGGWSARVDVDIRIERAGDEIAGALGLEPGAEVLVRDRVMYADDQPVQLATSYLPRDLTTRTAIEQENTGPGGVYARLEDAGHALPTSRRPSVSARHPSMKPLSSTCPSAPQSTGSAASLAPLLGPSRSPHHRRR